MIRRVVVVGVFAFAVGCGGTIGTNDGDGGAGGGAGGAGGGAGSGAFAGLSCDVANLLAAKCTSCHGSPLTGGASFPLLSRADLVAPSPSYAGQSIAQRSLARMQAMTAPMPPAPAARATMGELATFEAWVNAGAPEQTCGMVPDAGLGTPDAGPAPTVCTSSTRWTRGDQGSAHMHPGQPCRACHLTQEPQRAYFFMGTVFPTAHEQDNCNAAPPPNLVVDIIDANGNVAQTLPVRSPSGNFYSNSTSTSVALPYRARVRDGQGRTLMMNTPQMNGDCNTCHTEQGLNGAAGRIVWPQ